MGYLVLPSDDGPVTENSPQGDTLFCRDDRHDSTALWDASYPREEEDCSLQAVEKGPGSCEEEVPCSAKQQCQHQWGLDQEAWLHPQPTDSDNSYGVKNALGSLQERPHLLTRRKCLQL